MTAQEENLRVMTDYLNELSGMQQSAVGRIKIATESANDIGDTVWRTHGMACAASNLAVSSIETARDASGTKLYKVSSDLRDKLNSSSENYNDVDWREGRDLGACAV